MTGEEEVTRQTEEVDFGSMSAATNVYIFLAGEDKVCPVKGDELVDKFIRPQPKQTFYEGWKHDDFVKGAELEILVQDIEERLKDRPKVP